MIMLCHTQSIRLDNSGRQQPSPSSLSAAAYPFLWPVSATCLSWSGSGGSRRIWIRSLAHPDPTEAEPSELLIRVTGNDGKQQQTGKQVATPSGWTGLSGLRMWVLGPGGDTAFPTVRKRKRVPTVLYQQSTCKLISSEWIFLFPFGLIS